MRVAVLVPYRDEPIQNRAAHLAHFIKAMPGVLDEALSGHHWHIFVGVQGDDGHKFSRGKVLNALFKHAVMDGTGAYLFDRIILHDVDLIPDVARAKGFVADMSASASILAMNTTGEYAAMANYVGGICGMSPADFARVDGFPNEMEGWGGEDDALRDRLGPGRIGVYARGTVRNLETDPEFRGEGTVRAKDSPVYKMPKEDRRRVRDMWKRGDPGVTGLSGLVFLATGQETVATSISLVYLNVHVQLPNGWTSAVSRTSSRPYFVHAATRRTQWTLPCE